MNKSQKLAQKIEALRAELTAARAQETGAARAAARREIERAVRVSGLLSLVAAGGLTPEALADEFRRMAARQITARAPLSAGGNQAEDAADPEKRGWFGAR